MTAKGICYLRLCCEAGRPAAEGVERLVVGNLLREGDWRLVQFVLERRLVKDSRQLAAELLGQADEELRGLGVAMSGRLGTSTGKLGSPAKQPAKAASAANKPEQN